MKTAGLALMTAIVVATLSGCGSDDGGAESAAGASASLTPTETASPTAAAVVSSNGLPKCPAVWKAGETLPATYGSCWTGGEVYSAPYGCVGGERLETFDGMYARPGDKIRKDGKGFRAAVAECLGG